MRHLNLVGRRAPALAQRGLTLVELMVGVAITAMLALAAAPYFADYGVNSRLRESGNALYTEALIAQSEAIKRNRRVRLAASGSQLQVQDITDPANPVTLRTRLLPEGVLFNAAVDVDFGSQGWPANLTAAAVDLKHSREACSADFRCPGLRIEAAGAVRLCSNRLEACT